MEDFIKEDRFRSLHSLFHAMDNACEIKHHNHPTIQQFLAGNSASAHHVSTTPYKKRASMSTTLQQ